MRPRNNGEEGKRRRGDENGERKRRVSEFFEFVGGRTDGLTGRTKVFFFALFLCVGNSCMHAATVQSVAFPYLKSNNGMFVFFPPCLPPSPFSLPRMRENE